MSYQGRFAVSWLEWGFSKFNPENGSYRLKKRIWYNTNIKRRRRIGVAERGFLL